jgi:hypothetical protein
VGKAWEEVLADLQELIPQKLLDETGSGSVAELKSRFRNLKDNFYKSCKAQNKMTLTNRASRRKYKWHDR